MPITNKAAKRIWLKDRYSKLIDDSSDDKVELLFQSELANYPESQRKGFQTVLADHL